MVSWLQSTIFAPVLTKMIGCKFSHELWDKLHMHFHAPFQRGRSYDFGAEAEVLCAIIGWTNLMCLLCLHNRGYSKQGSWSLPHSSVNFSKSYRPQQPPSSHNLVISRLLNRFHRPGNNNHLKCCLRILLITLNNQLSNGVKMHKPCWLILQLLLITLPGTLIQVHLTMWEEGLPYLRVR